MLHTHDLVNHLKESGFDIQSVSIADSFPGELQDITDNLKTNPFVTVPFNKGFVNAKLPKCNSCDKKFSNHELVANHFKEVHLKDTKLETPLNAHSNKEMIQEQEKMSLCTQYEIFDSDFMPSEGDENNGDNTFYVVLKIDNCYDGLNSKSSHVGERRIRRPETKPRKAYTKSPGFKKVKTDTGAIALEGPFKCVQCEGVYPICCEYSKHFHEEHSKRKTAAYKCQICEKKFCMFPNNTSVREDQHTVSGSTDKSECTDCGRDFPTATQLYEHRLLHVKNKTIKCTFKNCNKMFTTHATLNQHTKLHSGIRPFACLVCPKSFTQKTGLEQHMRIHTSQRPYSCVICSTSFRQSAHLAQHMRTHSKVHPYICAHCPQKFKQSSHLSHHLQTVHPELSK